MKNDLLKQALSSMAKKLLKEELERQDALMKHINSVLDNLDKKELKITSVTPSNKSDMAIVIKFDDKENIDAGRAAIRKTIKNDITIEERVIPKFDPSIECLELSYNDGSGRVYLVFKYGLGSSEGLILEHLVALALTGKVTEELKNRLGLSPEATKEEIKAKLSGEFSDIMQIAIQGKRKVEEKIGKVVDSVSEGSRNSKADLILTNESGQKYGLSIKLVTEEGREVRFTYNKNLGYGDEQEDNLVKNPTGEAWWVVGRKIFADNLGRSYNPGKEDYEAPAWMTKGKENHPDLYKEAMEKVYEKMRAEFISNLRQMRLKELVDMVNEAHLGDKSEKNQYEKLLVLTSDVDGITLEEKNFEKPDLYAIKASKLNKTDLVKQDGAKIIINIPGMEELVIHGLKFHSNMLSLSKEDLKIKTR